MKKRSAPFLALCLLLGGCSAALRPPIENAVNRPTPLSFGLYVTPDPDENPIDPPERFYGFHAGLDFEVSLDELEEDVPVFAACGGEVLYGGYAEGYGGVLVQRCRLRNAGRPVR